MAPVDGVVFRVDAFIFPEGSDFAREDCDLVQVEPDLDPKGGDSGTVDAYSAPEEGDLAQVEPDLNSEGGGFGPVDAYLGSEGNDLVQEGLDFESEGGYFLWEGLDLNPEGAVPDWSMPILSRKKAVRFR